MGTVSHGTVVGVDEVHDVGNESPFYSSHHRLYILAAGRLAVVAIVAGSSGAVGYAVGHDDNHGRALVLVDEVVENLKGPSILRPTGLVAARTMKEVEDGITLSALLIARRSVDHQPAARHGWNGGIIPVGCECTVGNRLVEIVSARYARDDEEVVELIDITHGIGVAGVDDGFAVNQETVSVHLRGERWRGIDPLIAHPLHLHLAVASEDTGGCLVSLARQKRAGEDNLVDRVVVIAETHGMVLVIQLRLCQDSSVQHEQHQYQESLLHKSFHLSSYRLRSLSACRLSLSVVGSCRQLPVKRLRRVMGCVRRVPSLR